MRAVEPVDAFRERPQGEQHLCGDQNPDSSRDLRHSRLVAHALVRAASRLLSTHGVDLDTSVEADNGSKLTLVGLRPTWPLLEADGTVRAAQADLGLVGCPEPG
jgi:hypothetical protein